MKRAARFTIVLVIGIGLVTALSYFVLTRTTRDWFVRDVDLRARLSIESARRSLTSRWERGDADAVADVLADMTRDERIMGAAACSTAGELVAMTPSFPRAFTCSSLVDTLRRHAPGRTPFGFTSELAGGSVRLNALPVHGERSLGYVVLVHDLSFVSRREGTTRNQVILGFVALALAASAVTLLAARYAWRSWAKDLRLAVLGQPTSDFRPLVGDVRDLVDRLVRERDGEPHDNVWNPARLRSVLTQHLQGERVVVLANREPYVHERKADGTIEVKHPASGLVTALEPVMRACSGVWVAHGSGSADRDTVDAHNRVLVPPGEESYSVRRVWLTEEEERGYYYGIANEGLWPLCHVAHTRPVFRAEDWAEYVRVNRRFARAVCDEVDVDDPIVLVQDYHFALAPKMIREYLPRATILTFWHIPWPNPESFGICPYRDEIIAGLLGSSILGFHTRQHCNNFLEAVDTFIESRVDRETNAVVHRERKTLVRPYPISIEWPVRWLEDAPPVEACRASVIEELGLPADALIGVGVDRLDYTKGIEERLLAVDELLARYPQYRGRFTFVQLAAPSRTRIARYQDLNDRVESLASTINEKWGSETYKPIVLHRAHHEPPTVFRFYRAAELVYVSSLHDGMNLVAKEFVAARDDERGVLLLSQFTGAARELTEALIVNPYDLREASDALHTALSMSAIEQRERMRSMRNLVSELNVYRWAGRMLVDASTLRRRERLNGRLSASTSQSSPPAPSIEREIA